MKFDEHSRDKFVRLAGQRYNPDTDELTLIADKYVNSIESHSQYTLFPFRCPYRKQNYDYAQYLLTALYFESWVRIFLQLNTEYEVFLLILENGKLGTRTIKE